MDETARKRIALKVKLESLAMESRIIRRRERIAKKKARKLRVFLIKAEADPQRTPAMDAFMENAGEWADGQILLLADLNTHRRCHLRYQARISNLTMAYLRGRTYSQVENKNKPGNELHRGNRLYLQKTINRFGGVVSLEQVEKWISARKKEGKK